MRESELSRTLRKGEISNLSDRCERIARLLDPGARFLEIGPLIAYDKYDGQAPAAGSLGNRRLLVWV